MAITTQFLTGFEHGFVGAAATAGTGLFDVVTAGCSASTTTPRNGTYCAHLVVPATTVTRIQRTVTGSPTLMVMRVAVKVTALPSSGSSDIVFGLMASGQIAAIRVSSAGVLSAQTGAGTVQTGPTIDTTSWYRIELQLRATANPGMGWKVDGVTQTAATVVSAATTITAAGLGTSVATAQGYTADFDDWIVGTYTVANVDFYGDGKILGQVAGSDGTHATITSLSPGDAGSAYAGTPTTVYTMVDDAAGTGGWTATRSTTDNIALRTATVGAYAEIAPATTAETGSANAVRALLSYSSVTATANLAACDVRDSAAAVTALWGITGGTGADFSESTNFFKGEIITAPAGGWTASEVNAIRWRFGGCTSVDVSPIPTVQALMLEVDWPVSAVTEQIPSLVMAPPVAA